MRFISTSSQRIRTIALSFMAFILTFSWLGLSGCAVTAESEKAKPSPAADISSKPVAKKVEGVDPTIFDRSENIGNPWWPLKPGTMKVWEGYTETDDERIPHRIVFVVTDLTKVVAGVRCRVILEFDYSNGKVIEKELAFFAQDKRGNVWHLGQYYEVYEDDDFVGGRIWYAGNPTGAKAGIMMPADPQLGTPSYSEGYAPPPFNWTDSGHVYQMGQKTKVPTGSYDDVLVIEEFDAEHPGDFQLKYYARGVGNIRTGWRGKDVEERETLLMVKHNQLSPKDLAEFRATAFEMEKRASMYTELPPAERDAGAELVMDTSAGSLAESGEVRKDKGDKGMDEKISEEKAKEIALQAVPGDVTDVSIEKKLGANRYVVEVIAKEDRSETDVIIDMETGKILATEK
ncbi:MAG: PepSY domain-containing protein [Methylobacter sp.]